MEDAKKMEALGENFIVLVLFEAALLTIRVLERISDLAVQDS